MNSIREKREDERKKLRPEVVPQKELGNDSPIVQTLVSSTVISTMNSQDDGKQRHTKFVDLKSEDF